MIPFNKPCNTGVEEKYVLEAMQSGHISGDGNFTKKCQSWFEEHLDCKRALLTPSCTHALEMAAILIDIQNDDEVIMPSYTFVSTANAFVLRGAKVVFVDIHPDTMNIDETKIENAITNKTKAIVPVHYSGVSCEMDKIMEIANKYELYVIEDAAQGMMAAYREKTLGTIGHMGCYSFHETKNYTSGGEGGLLILNDEKFIERAEIIREKGTNRSKFFRGEVDKYSWTDIGSSYLPSELQAAYLWGQIENAEKVLNKRLKLWNYYKEKLTVLEKEGFIQLQKIPRYLKHNGHIFFLKVQDRESRDKLLKFLKSKEVYAVFHYVPLHTSEAGIKNSYFNGEDHHTTLESEKIVRLPMYYSLHMEEVNYIAEKVSEFFNTKQ